MITGRKGLKVLDAKNSGPDITSHQFKAHLDGKTVKMEVEEKGGKGGLEVGKRGTLIEVITINRFGVSGKVLDVSGWLPPWKDR